MHSNNLLKIDGRDCGLLSTSHTTDKFKIAVIGAGVAGLFSAMYLTKTFGNKVEVVVFEKHPDFDLEKGVELTISSSVQLAMLEMGVDFKKFRELGYPLKKDMSVKNANFEMIPQLEKEISDEYSGASISLPPDNKKYQLNEYSIKRGIFMDFLQNQLLQINNNKNVIHWNCDLKQLELTEEKKAKLVFSNKEHSGEFDFVIGADGVHSQVRKLFFDKELPHHVGANILYGVIPEENNFEENRFMVIVDKFTTVTSCYRELDKSISTWWAVIYSDQINSDKANIAFWEKQHNAEYVKHFAKTLAENNPALSKLIEQTPVKNFKYSGKFLERNPASLKTWGIGNVALVGDSIHAMMPWAGMGAALAAEDVFTLISLLDKHKVFENRETFEHALANKEFTTLYENYKKERINRVTYFYLMSHQMAPNGIMSENSHLTNITSDYGEQRSLASSPIFNKLLGDQLSSLEKRGEFFENPILNTKLPFSNFRFAAFHEKQNLDSENLDSKAENSKEYASLRF
jgi:2-polyprenyl-6-methoxyphenol hydroxylase-like FAD-dependent oxidoreductase